MFKLRNFILSKINPIKKAKNLNKSDYKNILINSKRF